MKISKHSTIKSLPVSILCLAMILLFAPFDGFAEKEEKQKEEPSQKAESTNNKKSNTNETTQSKYTGERGDFIFDNADLRNVLLFFAKTYKFNIILEPGIKGKVDCRLIDVPWDQALDLILRQHGYAAVREKGESAGKVQPAMKVRKM
ncbi:MAG: hypothetical protein GY940_01190 [bacterium]|nr:hypothetical protein [bacterium]